MGDNKRTSITSQSYSNDFFVNQRQQERQRSPSPSEFYRNQHKIQKRLWEREQNLNEFIFNGIQKFLDKQAVRDLINAYDVEEIFINGEEEFYENLFDDDDNKNQQKINSWIKQQNKFTHL